MGYFVRRDVRPYRWTLGRARLCGSARWRGSSTAVKTTVAVGLTRHHLRSSGAITSMCVWMLPTRPAVECFPWPDLKSTSLNESRLANTRTTARWNALHSVSATRTVESARHQKGDGAVASRRVQPVWHIPVELVPGPPSIPGSLFSNPLFLLPGQHPFRGQPASCVSSPPSMIVIELFERDVRLLERNAPSSIHATNLPKRCSPFFFFFFFFFGVGISAPPTRLPSRLVQRGIVSLSPSSSLTLSCD